MKIIKDNDLENAQDVVNAFKTLLKRSTRNRKLKTCESIRQYENGEEKWIPLPPVWK
jgi:hypothetical protein